MNQKKWNGSLGGVGFYAVLAVLLVAVGVAGYFVLYRNNTQQAAVDQEPDQQVAANTPPEVDLDSQVEVAGSAELPADSSDTETAGQAEVPEVPVVDDTPVVITEPSLTVSPVSGEVVTAFSVDELLYNQTMGDWRTHDGVDIEASAGTPVLSACAGTVSAVTDDPLMGTMVVVSHGDGCETTYANLQAQPSVEVGDEVTAGQVLGAVGSTAIAEKDLGPHLHFSVTQDGEAVDPNEFLSK